MSSGAADLAGGGRSRERLIAALVILLAVASWWPAIIDSARDVDVLLYSVAAAGANEAGALPYTHTWIEKGPLAMGLYQVLFALFGTYNLAAIVLAWLALALLTLLLVAALARAMGGGAWWAAALFALALPAVGGSLNTEVPAAAAAAAAVLVWWRTLPRAPGAGAAGVLVAGLLAGVAFLCRQNAGILAPILILVEMLTSSAGLRGSRRWRRPLLLLAGFAALPLLTVLIYALAGELEAFLFCFHGYNVNIYVAATRVTAARILGAPWEAVRNFLLPIPLVAALGLAGMARAGVTLWRARKQRVGERGEGNGAAGCPGAARATVLLTAVGLTLSLFAGLRFFAHYFALALPFWAALAGWCVASLLDRLKGDGSDKARRTALIVASLLALLMVVQAARRPWADTLRRTRDWVTSGNILAASDPLTWPRRDGLSTAVARYIRENSSEDAKVFVWGMRPHVQVYARRLPATRFVTSTFLSGVVPWERVVPADGTDDWIVPGAWDVFREEMERDRPLFIVDASQDHMFGQGAHAPERFPVLAEILARDYEEVASFGEADRMVVYRRR